MLLLGRIKEWEFQDPLTDDCGGSFAYIHIFHVDSLVINSGRLEQILMANVQEAVRVNSELHCYLTILDWC